MINIIFNHHIIPAEDFPLDVNDRGFLLGDGIFETMRSYQGIVPWLELHWQRLEQSAKILSLQLPLTISQLQDHAAMLLQANNLISGNAVLRLTLTRGVSERGLLPTSQQNPNFLITAQPLFPSNQISFSAQVSQIRRNELSPLSQIKSLNYLDNILAKQQAVADGFDEAIFLNTQGNLACASTANIFLVCERKLLTPALEQGTLSGITRRKIIELSRLNQIEVIEAILSQSDLQSAEAVFITNSLSEIMPLDRIDQIKYASSGNSLIIKLKEFYQQAIGEKINRSFSTLPVVEANRKFSGDNYKNPIF